MRFVLLFAVFSERDSQHAPCGVIAGVTNIFGNRKTRSGNTGKTNTNRFPESQFSWKLMEFTYVFTILLKHDFLFPGGAPKCYEFPTRSSPRTANRDVENRVPKIVNLLRNRTPRVALLSEFIKFVYG